MTHQVIDNNIKLDSTSFVLRQNIRYIAVKLIPAFIISIVLTIVFFAFSGVLDRMVGTKLMYALPFLPFLYLTYRFYYHRSYRYEITQERIITKAGIFFISTVYQEMYRIEYYEKMQNILTQAIKTYNLRLDIREANTERTIFLEGISERYGDLPHVLRHFVQQAKLRYRAITLN